MHTRSLSLVLAFALAAAIPAACSNEEPSPKSDPSSSGTAGGGGDDLFTDTDGEVELAIEPPNAVIEVVDGVSTPVDFDLLVDGQPAAAKWSVSTSSVATIDGDGVLSATGTKGGPVVVQAGFGNDSALADVTVLFKRVLNSAGATQAEMDQLRGASAPDGVTQWTYPYDRTVFPKGLFPPELMWNGGAAGDLYYVRMSSPYVDIEMFTHADAPSRVQMDDETWKQITESGNGVDVALHVARLSAGVATVVVDHEWTIAPGALRGTVYYWANNLGRIVRIKPGADGAPEDFLQGVNGCTACHTVSANGRTLVIGGDANTSAYDLLSDQTSLELQSVGKPVRNWAMPAVSPEGSLLIENNAPLPGPPGGSSGIFETATGNQLSGTGLEGVFLDMPAWGPAGTKIAYVRHEAPHDLVLFDFDAVSRTVSNQMTAVGQGNDPGLDAIAFPSVSPTETSELGDDTWVTYHRGVYPSSLDTRNGPGDLYLASADEPGVEMRLAQANGDTTAFAAGDRDRHYNYEPTFAPQTSGGYHWVVFTSRRTYGNRLTGGKDSVKQLWITAVDVAVEPGQDPSHPAFWLPGQDLDTLNMRGFWAHDPCKPKGESCAADSECCSGVCTDGVCIGLPPEECIDSYGACDTAADCCDPGDDCVGGVCTPPVAN